MLGRGIFDAPPSTPPHPTSSPAWSPSLAPLFFNEVWTSLETVSLLPFPEVGSMFLVYSQRCFCSLTETLHGKLPNIMIYNTLNVFLQMSGVGRGTL